GSELLDASAETLLRDELLPRATLITPNLPEAAKLLDCLPAQTDEEMIEQARSIQRLGATAVLLKGGHASGTECVDILVTNAITQLSATRINSKNTHGTGCTLSAAIAACLADGKDLIEAVRSAHAYVHNAIAHADALALGRGHGPVHHFYAHEALAT
ncbi:MAG: PfkB family carbohydrate kinase, partial [Pseudomonadota bacterium]